MALPVTYFPNYYSFEDILATQERVPCTFLQNVPNLGKMDASAESNDLVAGTELELPYWLVEEIGIGRPQIIKANIPKIYKESYREILKASAVTVDLPKLNSWFYEFGGYVKKFDSRDDIPKCLQQTFQNRFRYILNLCEKTIIDPKFVQKLDFLEQKIYKDGHAAMMHLNCWMIGSIIKYEASEMVQNLKKRKQLDLIDNCLNKK